MATAATMDTAIPATGSPASEASAWVSNAVIRLLAREPEGSALALLLRFVTSAENRGFR